MANWHLPATSVVSTGSQISTCEKVRFVKASPGSHVKLTNLHSNTPESVGEVVGVGVGTRSVENSCDKTWLQSMNTIRWKINVFIAAGFNCIGLSQVSLSSAAGISIPNITSDFSTEVTRWV